MNPTRTRSVYRIAIGDFVLVNQDGPIKFTKLETAKTIARSLQTTEQADVNVINESGNTVFNSKIDN